MIESVIYCSLADHPKSVARRSPKASFTYFSQIFEEFWPFFRVIPPNGLRNQAITRFDPEPGGPGQ
jgi:hypothetical protein